MKNRLARALACSLVVYSTAAMAFDLTELNSLDQRIQLALQQNPELRYYEAALGIAKGERTQAGLWKNPEVSGQYGSLRKTDPEGVLTGEGLTKGLSFSQTFEFPGKGSLRKAIANKNVEMAEMSLQQFRLALANQVRALSLRHQIQSERMEVAREISERYQAIRDLIRGKPSAGTGQWLEAKIIEGAAAELKQKNEETRLQLEETRLELSRLLGMPSSQEIPAGIRWSAGKWKSNRSETVLFALNHYVPLKIHELEIGKAAREVTFAALESAPDFSVGPFFSRDKAGDKDESFGITLSTTLPLWNWNQGNVRVAREKKVQAEAMLLDARKKVEGEVLRRCGQLESVERLLQDVGKKEVEEFRSAANLADRQYRLGAIPLSLYLEVQRQFWTSYQIYSENREKEWMVRCDLDLLTAGKAEVF